MIKPGSRGQLGAAGLRRRDILTYFISGSLQNETGPLGMPAYGPPSLRLIGIEVRTNGNGRTRCVTGFVP
jgi:hypothetical protein